MTDPVTGPTVSGQIARFVTGLRWDDIPEEVQSRARDRLLDAVSTAIYCRDLEVPTIARGAVSGEPLGPCTSLVDDVPKLPADAAFVNGVSCSAIFFDDFGPISSDHPGCMIVPTALATIEDSFAAGSNASLRDLLTAITVGYEVELALGETAPFEAVVAAGFRPTPVFGSVATAAAAARAYGLNYSQVSAAVNIGANAAGGLPETRALGTAEGYLQPGMASRAGIFAAKLARAGAQTAALTFEGPAGYFNAFGVSDRADDFTIGDRWRILEVWAKPFPFSAGKQPIVGTALSALEGGLRVEDIVHVTAELKSSSVDYSGRAMDRRGPYESFNSAQISLQFCLGAALLGYDMTSFDTFRDHYADTKIAAFTEIIDVIGFDGDRAETLVVELKNGTVERYESPWDDIIVPSIPRMAKKLASLSRGFWPSGTVDDVVALVCGHVDVPVTELSELLRRRGA